MLTEREFAAALGPLYDVSREVWDAITRHDEQMRMEVRTLREALTEAQRRLYEDKAVRLRVTRTTEREYDYINMEAFGVLPTEPCSDPWHKGADR